MKTLLLMAASALFGAGAVYLFHRRQTKLLRTKLRALRAGIRTPEEKRAETMKRIVWVCVLNGIAWIWCSYILAAFDKAQIAESLSVAAVTEIIGAVLAYAIKSLIENLSKNNHWPDKASATSEDGEEPPEQQEPTGSG